MSINFCKFDQNSRNYRKFLFAKVSDPKVLPYFLVEFLYWHFGIFMYGSSDTIVYLFSWSQWILTLVLAFYKLFISNLVVHISGNKQNCPSLFRWSFFSVMFSWLMFTKSGVFSLRKLSLTPITLNLTYISDS